jgi:prevent-host-death family protein
MERASVRDLHIRTSELVRAAAEGSVIIIERRGEPVAELRPIHEHRSDRRKRVARMCAEMASVWQKMPQVDTDSGRFLEEDR